MIVRLIRNVVCGFVIALATGFSIQYSYETFTPNHWYVEFEKIQTYDKYLIGEQPRFISFSRYPRGGDVYWNDILNCDTNFDGVFDFYSDYNTERKNGQSQQDIVQSPWVYQGTIPRIEAACYLESNVEVVTQLGRQKNEKTITTIFYFVPSPETFIKPLLD